jgi:hypothetical protein
MMANIAIPELHPMGSSLFQDSEGFLDELGEPEMNCIVGGGWTIVVNNPALQVNLQITHNINSQQFTINNARNLSNQQP